MLRSLFDGVMERRATALIGQLDGWLPRSGRVLDLGSGTGHLAATLERDRGLQVVAADVTDMHVTGPRPVLVSDGMLPFPSDSFATALLVFMLGYPRDPATVLREAARVTRGPVIVVQSVNSGRIGRAWHRAREFVWTVLAFHVSRVIGYVPPDARFSMSTRRFYTERELHRDVTAAGLRVRSKRERPVLPGRALVVAGWELVRDA